MSIDLEWCQLDSSLSTTLVDMLNRQLTSTTRPSFIGPVEVTSLEFGSAAPDVELVDLRDIYRDFMEDDEDDDKEPAKAPDVGEDDEFEWVSRRGTHKLHPAEIYAAAPSLHSPNPGPGYQSMVDFRPGFSNWPYTPEYNSPSGSSPSPAPAPASAEPQPPPPPAEQPAASNESPNIQLHLNINWNSDLRITLTTSLLINYPSPMFMSLPIKLSITGLVFTGQVAVAYEGERRRVHICILDELDPYGPHPKRDLTPPDADHPSSKPLPVGQRLLPSIFIESEIGQADKHVLKNVTRVERFIQDVIRKTVEEELVFPNFHTMLMGDKW